MSNEVLLDLGLAILYLFSSVISSDHDSRVETFLVSEFFSFSELFDIFGRVDLHFFNESFRGNVSVSGSLEDRYGFESDPGRINVVEFGFLAKIEPSYVIVGRIGSYANDDGSTLFTTFG